MAGRPVSQEARKLKFLKELEASKLPSLIAGGIPRM
jgi:hypothetical protein